MDTTALTSFVAEWVAVRHEVDLVQGQCQSIIAWFKTKQVLFGSLATALEPSSGAFAKPLHSRPSLTPSLDGLPPVSSPLSPLLPSLSSSPRHPPAPALGSTSARVARNIAVKRFTGSVQD